MMGIFDNKKVLHLPKTYELTPEYDSAKSFYGKARIERYYINSLTVEILTSYGTPILMAVFEHVDNPAIYRLWGGYSATTQRHINEYLRLTEKKAWDSMETRDIYDTLKTYTWGFAS